MNNELRERMYKNTMELYSLNQLLEKEKNAFAAAHTGERPDFAKLSLIASRMCLLFHKMELAFQENDKIREDLEKEIFE